MPALLFASFGTRFAGFCNRASGVAGRGTRERDGQSRRYAAQRRTEWGAPMKRNPSFCAMVRMVALAGLSFKKPILYSRNEAISHYFVDGKSGISYQMQDSDDLIKKIEFLMKNNKIRNEIAMEGYRIYVNNFLERNQNDQILKIIFPT